MIKMDFTSGSQIDLHLTDFLDEFNIREKIVAYVTDGGAKLTTCSRQLQGIVCCAVLDIYCICKVDCWAQIMSSLCRRALSEDHCSSFNVVSSKQVQRKLQLAITWTKKSGKGNQMWHEACRKVVLRPIQLYTPVKTRFGYVFVLFSQILAYREAAHACYAYPNNSRDRH